ncbi:30S ribosomal protein S14 [Candidatus Karelsulcia muelleri]|uniref:30S ribosomal protein S14 n=1 Tax=Candidatus Karelsulcia muelleri TaxID=336810 RepID=UPI0007F9BCE5|nr:30S ribosomal protein S14 [Candidatus Karelsulcia muelleri]ANO35802.1 30S ribosomal protein S14 [Candidatus Karelsulcia muelleri]QSF25191.1 30S ribosomal protein S14 [Candidatus Karelsulcia muelleri]WKD87234.1 30S ribosomal protein S14 [Candidatus Karelsulcia muelleri]BEH03665.1 30S ribosomal subunit protein S14 [Candidatus Karelsulcia muelleri]
MSKESIKARQKKRKILVLKYAKKRQILKLNRDYEGLQKLPRNSSPIRLHNLCSLTGRTKGYMRKFGISRIEFRRLASQGFIPGIVKASW